MPENKVVVNHCYGGFGLSESAAEYLNNKYGMNIKCYYGSASTDDIMDRHDPRLVDVVETLGENASGDFAKLVVETIQGNQYRIDEYDGSESVITPAEQDWITI